MTLDGKRAVVTGASSGIGAAIARAFSEAGASVLGVARDERRLQQVASECGPSTGALTCDVTEDGAATQIVAAACEQLGGLDVLVHSAGVFEPQPFADTSSESLDRQLSVNVRAPFLITQAAVKELRGGGVVLFLSSVCGHVGFPGSVAYCASKGAVELMVKALAVDLAGDGIRVNAIAPGWTESPMNASILADQDYKRSQVRATPLGRLGHPSDVGDLAVFLASDAASYIHGASMWIDGGFPAPPRLEEQELEEAGRA